MKKLLLITILLASLITAKAETIATNLATATNYSVINFSCTLQSVLAANASTNAITVYLYDAPSTNLTYTNAAYTTTNASAPVNVVVTHTNFFGRTNSWTNYVITNVTVTVAASTNTFPLLTTIVVPASTSVQFIPAESIGLNRGLMATNSNTNLNLTVTFQRQ